jgi:predicted secreted protein
MRVKYFLCIALTLAALSASPALAGDFANLGFVGFSRDGRYLAVEEYGSQDGSGYPYANIYFIDTAKNTYAAPRVAVMIENESASEASARTRAAALAAAKLKRFGIVKDNSGKLLVAHLMTDTTYDDGSNKDSGLKVTFDEEVWSMRRQGFYEITLKPVKTKVKDCEAYEQDTFMLELMLTDQSTDTSRLLQKDTSLPAARGCALSYSLQNVYLYKGLLTVLIQVYTQGFEGPDMRYMVVTGKLK